MPFMLARLGATALPLVALGRNPYDFYTILRWVVCGVCSYGALSGSGGIGPLGPGCSSSWRSRSTRLSR